MRRYKNSLTRSEYADLWRRWRSGQTLSLAELGGCRHRHGGCLDGLGICVPLETMHDSDVFKLQAQVRW